MAGLVLAVVLLARFAPVWSLVALYGVWVAAGVTIPYLPWSDYGFAAIVLVDLTLPLSLPGAMACLAGGALRHGRGWGTPGIALGVVAFTAYGVVAAEIARRLMWMVYDAISTGAMSLG